MAKVSVVGGTTSYITTIFIQDSASATGAGKTGLAFNTASLTAYYVRPGSAAASITLATQTTTGAYSSGGFVEIDATNLPGFYRFDVPNAVLAASVKSAAIMLGAAGMVPVALEFEITAFDNQTATVTVGTNNDKTGYALSTAGVNAAADGLLDRTDGVETGWTLRQALRVGVAALFGKCSGGGTTSITYRNPPDSKNRIVATVDSSGNRTAVTTDVS